MNPTMKTLTACLVLVALAALCGPLCGPVTAQNQATSDLLLPYFEVDAANPGGLTTLFAVGNSKDEPVDVNATVYTNWGIPILDVPFTLRPREIRTVNLRDWFRQGGDPTKALPAVEVEHLAAAASGQRSPKDNLYYSSEVRPDLQVGYVTLRTQANRPDALWGDWFNVDVGGNLARGDVLVNIDRSAGCPGVCHRHLLRYLSGGGFDGGTEVIIWRANVGKPSPNPDGGVKMQADATALSEPGQAIENRKLALLPVEKVLVSELGLQEAFGALDVETEEETFFAVQHSAENRYSVGLTTYCLPIPPKTGPEIHIRKLTNGEDADAAPGPSIPIGATVTWEYLVTNTGNVELTDVEVDDDKEGAVSCPHDTLAPGESMTCTETGTAKACQYANVGTVSALSPSGQVDDSDPSHYFGDDGAALSIASILVNGEKADAPKGPGFEVDTNLNWTFKIANTGKVRLTGVQLSGIAAACPKTALDPDESMDCTASGKALNGDQSLPVSVTGDTACSEAVANGTGYYVGSPKLPPTPSSIQIVKLTNDQDANTAPGPTVAVGSPVTWKYVVTNTGEAALNDVKVTDDKGVTVSCPKTSLAAGESMTCTGSGTAQACQYQNLGTVTAKDPVGNTATDSDPSHYYGLTYPAIDVETKVNGDDADNPTGPEVAPGSSLSFTYIVKNTGDSTLTGVAVSDSKGVAVSCPKTTLAAGESMTCTGSGTAQSGQYSAVGSANGNGACGQSVSDSDPVHYFGKGTENPGIKIVKKTNGQDANTAPGPEIAVGSTVTWTYIVTNTGDVALSNVKVTDDQGVAVSCPKTTLAAGETMTCTGSGKAVACQYANLGTATGKSPAGQTVSAMDPSHYYGKTYPDISVEAKINGDYADTPKGPEFPVGATVPFTYWVKNTGDTTLTGITVIDSKGVAVTCPKTTLTAGESMFCSGSGIAQAGQYSATATATGTGACGQKVSDDDPVHYYGKSKVYDEGCSHGYWKNHSSSWPATGYSTSQKVSSAFSQAGLYPSLGNATLHQSLSFSGGSDVTGAAGNLLKQATGSLLNAAHPGVDFPYSKSDVINAVNAALASKNSSTILNLASDLDDANNLGCPLN